MKNNLSGSWNAFDALGPRDVHDLLKLRQNIFVLEQNCLFAEIDGHDPETLHYLMRDRSTGELAGALRLGVIDGGAVRIGRVVVAQSHRGCGLGRDVMNAGIGKARQMWPGCRIHLSAQAHLADFYRSLGFRAVSDIYLEDDIPHLDMIA